MSNVRVLAVTVSYRTADLVIRGLQSLAEERAAGLGNLEVIVVDNDSGDYPAIQEAIVQHLWTSWVTALAAPRNGGFAYGNNFALRHYYARRPKPDYVYLLNPDAWVKPGALRALVDSLESRPSAGIAGSSFETPDGRPWPIAFRFPGVVSEVTCGLGVGLIERLLRRWTVAQVMTDVEQPIGWVSGASMLIRASTMEEVGGLDERYFLYFEETDFCLRARRTGHFTWYVPRSRVVHLIGHTTSVSNSADAFRSLPAYWFESRRRYFYLAYGWWGSAIIDVCAIAANALGAVKQWILGRERRSHFVRDLIRFSILRRRNRVIAERLCFPPARRNG